MAQYPMLKKNFLLTIFSLFTGLIILGREHKWEEINKFTSENKFDMPFYPDIERKVFSLYAKQNIPRNFIIDKDGKIAVASTGFNEKEFAEIIGKVEKMLE